MDEAQLTSLVGATPGQGPLPGKGAPGKGAPAVVGGDGKVACQAGDLQQQPVEKVAVEGGTEGLPTLSPLQERAMVALLASPTVPQAAKASKVGLRTIRGWLANDRNFSEQYRNARRELVGEAVQVMQERAKRMAELIAEIAECGENPVGIRLAAARLVLDLAFRGTELLDVSEQLLTTQEAVEEAERRNKRGGR